MIHNSKCNIPRVLFDIRPVDETEQVDFEKINGVRPVVDLVSNNKELGIRNYGIKDNLENQKTAFEADLGNNGAEFPLSRRMDVSRPSRTIAYERVGSTGSRVYTNPQSVASRLKLRQDSSATLSRIHNNNFSLEHQEILKKGKNLDFDKVFASSPKQSLPGVVIVDIKKQNSAAQLEKYLNSKLNIERELKAVGAKVEKFNFGAKPRVRPICGIMSNELGIMGRGYENLDHNSKFLIPNS